MATAAEKRALTKEIKAQTEYLKDITEAYDNGVARKTQFDALGHYGWYLGDKIRKHQVQNETFTLNSMIKRRKNMDI